MIMSCLLMSPRSSWDEPDDSPMISSEVILVSSSTKSSLLKGDCVQYVRNIWETSLPLIILWHIRSFLGPQGREPVYYQGALIPFETAELDMAYALLMLSGAAEDSAPMTWQGENNKSQFLKLVCSFQFSMTIYLGGLQVSQSTWSPWCWGHPEHSLVVEAFLGSGPLQETSADTSTFST